MSQSANVRSIEAIHDFKVALTNFAEDARNALGSTEMEVRRTRDWLQRDQLGYWQAQIKRCQEQVSTARTELHRRKLSQQGSDSISDTEQKENLRAATRRLEEAERKVAQIKKWIPVLDHAISEYHSASQPLGDRLSGALVNSMNLLLRMVATLESYASLAPPSAAPAAAGPGPAGAPASTGSAPASRGAADDTEGSAAGAEPEGAATAAETAAPETPTPADGGPRP